MKLVEHIPVPEGAEASLLFGLICYSDRHPYLKRVLREPDFWNAIDEISGGKWSIYSSRFDSNSAPTIPGSMSAMRSLGNDHAVTQQILNDLGVSANSTKPLLIVFMLSPDQPVMQSQIELADESESIAFERLRTVVSDLRTAIEKAPSENADAVYNAASSAMRLRRAKDCFQSLGSIIDTLRKYAQF